MFSLIFMIFADGYLVRHDIYNINGDAGLIYNSIISDILEKLVHALTSWLGKPAKSPQ